MRDQSRLEQTDASLAHLAKPLGETGPVKVIGALSELADQPQLYTICGGTIALGAVTRNAKLARTGLRMLAAEWLATQLKTLVKHRVDRLRPEAMKTGHDNAVVRGNSREHELSSFPSGHTAGALAVARAVRHEYPESQPLAYAIAAVVAAVQVPRGKHYLSDVAAGAAIGLVAERLVTVAERAVATKGEL